MNRTIKDATVKRFYYESHDQLRHHLASFVTAYNFGRRLKTSRASHPTNTSAKIWKTDQERFKLDSSHQIPGLITYPRK